MGDKLSSSAVAARQYAEAGLSVIRILPDGRKAPAGRWKTAQSVRMDPGQAATVFGGAYGIGIVCGAVSGGLEVIDFDVGDFFQRWLFLINSADPELYERLPVVRTPRDPPGYHVYFRSENVAGNQKLAMLDDSQVAIETRGEGGYVLAPGGDPRAHSTGKPYEQVSGPPLADGPPTITAAERDFLLHTARMLDVRGDAIEIGAAASPFYDPEAAGERPGDRYNREATWPEILEPHGWILVCQHPDGSTHWRRPGKTTPGISATCDVARRKQTGDGFFYCFSSNAAPFQQFRCYDKFACYTLLNHGGDFREAGKTLAAHYRIAPSLPEPPADVRSRLPEGHGGGGDGDAADGEHGDAGGGDDAGGEHGAAGGNGRPQMDPICKQFLGIEAEKMLRRGRVAAFPNVDLAARELTDRLKRFCARRHVRFDAVEAARLARDVALNAEISTSGQEPLRSVGLHWNKETNQWEPGLWLLVVVESHPEYYELHIPASVEPIELTPENFHSPAKVAQAVAAKSNIVIDDPPEKWARIWRGTMGRKRKRDEPENIPTGRQRALRAMLLDEHVRKRAPFSEQRRVWASAHLLWHRVEQAVRGDLHEQPEASGRPVKVKDGALGWRLCFTVDAVWQQPELMGEMLTKQDYLRLREALGAHDDISTVRVQIGGTRRSFLSLTPNQVEMLEEMAHGLDD